VILNISLSPRVVLPFASRDLKIRSEQWSERPMESSLLFPTRMRVHCGRQSRQFHAVAQEGCGPARATNGTKPVLLHTKAGVGHGNGIPVDAEVAAKAAAYVFLLRIGDDRMTPPDLSQGRTLD
jgi:hypothetical protein